MLRASAFAISALLFAGQLGVADEGPRVVPFDKVWIGNRLAKSVKLTLLPDGGDYTVPAGGVEEFTCAVVTGVALPPAGKSYRVRCGKRYTISAGQKGLELLEVVLK